MSTNGDDTPHLPGPSVWPIAFAVGVACLLLGLVISWIVALVGAILVVVFGLLWARDVTREVRGEVPYVEPEARAVDAGAVEGAVPEPLPGFTRSGFLEVSLIGLSAALGAVLTLPVLGFMVLPPFTDVEEDEVDLGPIGNFPEGQYVIATYLALPQQGEVTGGRRSFATTGSPRAASRASRSCTAAASILAAPFSQMARSTRPGCRKCGVELRPVLAQSFGCPCHGGLYDAEGNRQAGPPVRSMDRYSFSIRNGNLVLGELFAVGNVSGAGASATISRYRGRCPGRTWTVSGLAVSHRAEPGDGLVARIKTRRQKLVETAVLVPLDWIDERSALVRGTKWFLFRNIPRDISWAQTLGFATLIAFTSQALTGVILAMYYKPSSEIDPATGKPIAYTSIEHITNEVTLGWLVRGMHRWGASVFVILMFLHMARVFLFGAYKTRAS